MKGKTAIGKKTAIIMKKAANGKSDGVERAFASSLPDGASGRRLQWRTKTQAWINMHVERRVAKQVAMYTEEMCEKAIEKSEKKTAEKKEEEKEKSAISGKGTGIEKEKSVSEIEKAIEEAMKSVAKKKPYK